MSLETINKMQTLPVFVQKISGSAGDNIASNVFVGKANIFGHDEIANVVFCISCEVNNPSAGEENQDLKKLVGGVYEYFLGKLEGSQDSTFDALKNASLATEDYCKTSDIAASFGVLLFAKNACYVFRTSDTVKVFVFQSGRQVELAIKEGSGQVKSGQIYILGTEEFFKIFDFSELSGGVDLANVVDGVATLITSQEEQSKIAAAFAAIGDEEKEPEATAVEEKEEEKPEEAVEVDKPEEKGESTELALDSASEPEKSEDVKEERREEVLETALAEESTVPNAEVEKVDEARSEIDTQVEEEGEEERARFNLLGLISGVALRLLGEVKRLRGGDVGAILRLRRNIVIIAILIFVILGTSVFIAQRNKQNREKDAAIEGYLTSASSNLSAAEAIIEINKARARDLLISADRDVKSALEVDSKNEKALSLAASIANRLKETEQASGVSFSTFADVGEEINSILLSDSDMVVVGEGQIFVVDSEGEEKTKIKISSGVRDASVYDRKAFVVLGDKIIKVNLSDSKSEEVIRRGNIGDIGVFVGNIYLLAGNTVLKMVPVENGYSNPTDYLTTSGLGDKSNMAIDGSIWLTAGSKIQKYTRGEKEDFEISGLVGGTGEFSLIYTSVDIDNLYVVDQTNSALLVIGKDGNYKKVYQSTEFSKATSVLVDNSEKKMYLSVGSRILSADL